MTQMHSGTGVAVVASVAGSVRLRQLCLLPDELETLS